MGPERLSRSLTTGSLHSRCSPVRGASSWPVASEINYVMSQASFAKTLCGSDAVDQAWP